VRYHVYMLGFLPGFPYMGDLPPQLALPRRADPRLRVPAGSVSIATTLTAIYPYESPGGWHLIGVTPIRLFDPARPRPALLAPGDIVRFEPIDLASFAEIRKAVGSGDYEVANEPITDPVSSLPGLTRQSASQVSRDCMDARHKAGHDG
jgi:inhibitor of KinA